MNSKRTMNRRRIATREPEHHETGMRGSQQAHMSHASPASRGATIGPGPLPGAGMLDSPGSKPGPAAGRVMGRSAADVDNSPTPSGAPPKGMQTYNQE